MTSCHTLHLAKRSLNIYTNKFSVVWCLWFHINFHELFYAGATTVKEHLWNYLTHGLEEKGFYNFSKRLVWEWIKSDSSLNLLTRRSQARMLATMPRKLPLCNTIFSLFSSFFLSFFSQFISFLYLFFFLFKKKIYCKSFCVYSLSVIFFFTFFTPTIFLIYFNFYFFSFWLQFWIILTILFWYTNEINFNDTFTTDLSRTKLGLVNVKL